MESGVCTRTEYTLTSLLRKGKGTKASGKRKIASFPHLTPVVERSQYQGLLPSSRFSRSEEERETNRSIQPKWKGWYSVQSKGSHPTKYSCGRATSPRSFSTVQTTSWLSGTKPLDKFRSQGKSLVTKDRLAILTTIQVPKFYFFKV